MDIMHNSSDAPPTLQAAGFVVASREEHSGWCVLLVRSARDGYWGLPKGHVCEGESGREAARRELREETGLDGLDEDERFQCSIRYSVQKGQDQLCKQVSYFLALTNRQPVQLSSEHVAYRWESPDEAMRLLPFDNLRGVVKAAAERLEEIDKKGNSPFPPTCA